MPNLNQFKATTALFLTLSLGSGMIIPLTFQAPAVAQNNQFSDVSQNYWAANFIKALVQRGIVAGFPDGTFQPDAPVTRAQFAAMVTKAFEKEDVRSDARFVDVPSNFWAASAVSDAYRTGFLSGYPGRIFSPNQNIPREQVLVSLANGLNYRANDNVTTVLEVYNDRDRISNFAKAPIAAATQENMVVNYPNLSQLRPTRNATRAEVAAFIYQSLVSEKQASPVNSQYIVSSDVAGGGNFDEGGNEQAAVVSVGTRIPVAYEKEKILLTKKEKLDLTLTVAREIKASNGSIAIPEGSEIAGELRPTNGGTQFVAEELILPDGSKYKINATSGVVTETETVSRDINVGKLVRNAAIGTAAAAAISAVTGDRAIATEELLLGAGAGVLATLIPQFLGDNKVDLIVVEPNTDLRLTLQEDLIVD
jgi:hypothetical protein